MFRPSRSVTTWLLWLAIALLPVRAWAAAAMPADMGSMSAAALAAAHQDAGEAEHAPPAPPCHGGGDPADDAAAPQACSLCGVCHAAFALLPSVDAAVQTAAPERPMGAFVSAVETAALAGLERPPRPLLA